MVIADVLKFLAEYGVIGFLTVAWWLERADKKSAESENAKLSREMLAHIAEQKMLSANLLAMFGKHQP